MPSPTLAFLPVVGFARARHLLICLAIPLASIDDGVGAGLRPSALRRYEVEV